ncbi:MAG: hypothetical protein KGH75_09975 [Rhodospirillales bacterium]|nr:hypothetical protein [Rhodospirillales bacterium]
MTDITVQIADAISTHGARSVYAAATKAMQGKRDALTSIGIPCDNMGHANTAMTAAFAQLGAVDRLLDKASIDQGSPQ